MKGPVPFEIPDFFNCEWYSEQKKLGKTDKVISSELFISLPLLVKWKRLRCIKSAVILSGRKNKNKCPC